MEDILIQLPTRHQQKETMRRNLETQIHDAFPKHVESIPVKSKEVNDIISELNAHKLVQENIEKKEEELIEEIAKHYEESTGVELMLYKKKMLYLLLLRRARYIIGRQQK